MNREECLEQLSKLCDQTDGVMISDDTILVVNPKNGSRTRYYCDRKKPIITIETTGEQFGADADAEDWMIKSVDEEEE